MVVTEPSGPGRRERKRTATHNSLIDVALRLFDEQGYDATSVEQIADAVDVSARTFHRYFPNKEDVLFAANLDGMRRFAEALASRPSSEPVFVSLREAAASFASRVDASFDMDLRARIVASHEGLHNISLRIAEQWNQVAAEFVAERLGLTAGDRVPRLVGRCAVAAMITAHEQLVGRPPGEDGAEIRTCFDVLADLPGATHGSMPG